MVTRKSFELRVCEDPLAVADDWVSQFLVAKGLQVTVLWIGFHCFFSLGLPSL